MDGHSTYDQPGLSEAERLREHLKILEKKNSLLEKELLQLKQEKNTVALTEAKLQETHRKLYTLIGNLNGIVYRCKNDSEWTMLFLSDAVFEMTGYTSAEILSGNPSFTELMNQHDLKKVSDEMVKAIADDKRFTLEYRITTKQGKTKWFWEQGIGVREPNGQVNTIEGYIIDITDRKKIEIALSESEEKFKKAFQSSPAVIMLTAAEDGRFIEANDSFEQIVGFSKEEYLGKTTGDIRLWANPSDRETYVKLLQTKGLVKNMEFEFRTKTGEIRNGLVSGHMLRLQTGEVILGVLTDITEQKQSQIRLNNERIHLRTLLRTIPDLIWLKDPDGVYLNCNPGFEAFFGAKEADIVGKTDYDFVSKALADFFRQNDQNAMQANQPSVNHEWVTFASDGRRVLLETVKTPMFDAEGRLTGVLGVARDITQNKQNEEALKESENWYRAIFNNTGTATCIIDEDATLVLVNEKLEELIGYPKEELENKRKWPDFVDKKDLERMAKYHEDRRKNGDNPPKQYEFVLIDRWETRHHILLNIDLIPGTRMSVASLLDISARIQALNELRESREKYQNLVENVNDIIFELDGNWNFSYISPNSEVILGYRPETYIGKFFMDTIVAGDLKRIQAYLEEVLETKIAPQIDFRPKTADNRLVWLRASSKLIVENDIVVGVRGVCIDVTKQKEIEAELIHAKEEAEKADRLKSAFLASMSHELRTPLNAIIGFSNLIDESLPKETMIEMAGIIHNSGNHLLSIIESIFELAMLQSKESKLKVQKFHLADLLKNLQFFMNSELEKQDKTHIRTSFPAFDRSRHIVLQTDQTKLTQLLVNLLANAVKYTEKGEINMNWEMEGHAITFAVKDTGIGIPEEKQPIVFDRFRQVDDSITRKYSGVGLGLAICKEIAELLQGELWLDSEFGSGSTFYFKLGNVVEE